MDVRARIQGTVCGLDTVVEARCSDGTVADLVISSDCPKVEQLAAVLVQVDAIDQVLRRPLVDTDVASLAAECGLHTTCLVPVAILKAAEAAAGLALPRISTIEVMQVE